MAGSPRCQKSHFEQTACFQLPLASLDIKQIEAPGSVLVGREIKEEEKQAGKGVGEGVRKEGRGEAGLGRKRNVARCSHLVVALGAAGTRRGALGVAWEGRFGCAAACWWPLFLDFLCRSATTPLGKVLGKPTVSSSSAPIPSSALHSARAPP